MSTSHQGQDTRSAFTSRVIYVATFVSLLVGIWITRDGIAVIVDSIKYLQSAENAFNGNGITFAGKPLTNYPPGYPLLLAVASVVTNGDAQAAACIVGIILLAIHVLIATRFVQSQTRSSLTAILLVVLSLWTSAGFIAAHRIAMSEAFFFLVSTAALMSLSLCSQQTSVSRRWFYAAVVLTSLAIQIRYVGVALLVPGMLLIWSCRHDSVRRRLIDCVCFLAITCVPLGLWFVRNRLSAGEFTEVQALALHPFSYGTARAMLTSAHRVFIPLSLPGWLEVLNLLSVTLFFSLGIVYLARKNLRSGQPLPTGVLFPMLCMTYVITYLAILILATVGYSAGVQLSGRAMLTMFVPMMLGFIVLARNLSDALNRKWIWSAAMAVGILSISAHAYNTVKSGVYTSTPLALNSPGWKNSEVIAWLDQMPPEVVVYSNGADVIGFHSDRTTRMYPKKIGIHSRLENPEFTSLLVRMLNECERGEAVIVDFDRFHWRTYLPSAEEILQDRKLSILSTFDDSVVYGSHVRQQGRTDHKLVMQDAYPDEQTDNRHSGVR